MSSVVRGRSKGRRENIPRVETRVSAYDRVSGTLLALVVFFALIALSLFMLWLTRVITFAPTPSKVFPIDDLKGRGENAQGVGREFEEPGVEELADVQEPQLADAMEAVSQTPSPVAGQVQAIDGNAAQMGTGKGLGDSRASGPGGDGNADAIPPHERWEINYTTSSLRAYAAQLDHFKIELGAVHRSKSDIEYAKNLSQPKPDRDFGSRGDEGRIYFSHLNKQLREFDRQLLQKAGIDTSGKLIVQFYPAETTQLLLNAERQALGGKPWESLLKTIFGVRGSGSSYEYYVIRQEFR